MLLQEALMSLEKNKTEDKECSAKNALLDVGVKNTSVETALKILRSRIDWPKI